jgi:hypothetical protein
MIAKGNLHGNGAKLARYMMTGEKGEIAQVVETRGLDGFGGEPVKAFAILQQTAEAHTNCKLPFFHAQTRLPAGETLSDKQWLEVADREEKRLGFTGQPRIVAFHINPDTGEKHLHCAWFRVDLETMRAIDPGMYKNHLKLLSRTLEKEFALREITNTRQPHDRARYADRREVEESRRLGTDVRAIRTAILDCFEKSDNGRAFKAALDERGFQLANGDRRDCFVVVDAAGGQHALNKKLTGKTLAETRTRLSDLDRTQLPTVEQAQEVQAERAARAAQERVKHGGAERAANQNACPEPMTVAALENEPWKAVDLALPKDADRTLLATAALCADQCAKVAFAYGRVAAVIEPEAAEFYRERHDSAAGRRDEARSELARLAPEQTSKVSPFLHPERVAQLAESDLQTERAAQILARSEPRTITPEAIRENPWNILQRELPQDAGRELAMQVLETARGLYREILEHREASYTEEERRLWDHTAGVIEFVRFRQAGARLTELDRQELEAGWRETAQESTRPAPENAQQAESSADQARRDFGAARSRVTEPGVFDRDAADRRWSEAVEDAAIKAAAREANQPTRDKSHSRDGTETAGKAPQSSEAKAASTAPRQSKAHVSEPPRAAQTEIRQTVAEAERATTKSFADAGRLVKKGLGFGSRLLGMIGDHLTAVISGVADMFAPTAPPTREEIQGKQRAAEDRERQAEPERAVAAQEARLQELLDQIRRNDAQARLRRERGEERDDDRGRERER